MIRIERLRREVLEANLTLARSGLVVYSFGNASGIDREQGIIVIKPSGVPCDRLTPDEMVVTDIEGRTRDGSLRPSTDLPTHLALYRAFPDIGGVAHTHSRFATAWAQAQLPIPCLGTTHADYFRGEIPVTEPLSETEIAEGYEFNTGLAIVRRLSSLDPSETPAALVAGHAPFCWGPSATEAARMAEVVEELAHIAWLTLSLNPAAGPLPEALREKHFLRKHGPGAYYGQR